MSAINNSKELLSNYIDNDVIKFGDVKKDDVLNINLPFTDTSAIHYITHGCGPCTKTKVEGDKITGTLTVSKAIGTPAEGTVNVPINRTFNIFLDPNEPEFISDDNGTRIANPKKYWITVTMLGNVIL